MNQTTLPSSNCDLGAEAAVERKRRYLAKMRENKNMSESPSQAGKEIPTKKQKLSSDENSNPDLSGDENVSS